jgi:hypothetical protein
MKMKVYAVMPKKLVPYYQTELATAESHWRHNEFGKAWHHLERAHIIAQEYPYEHSYVHWKMLQFGIGIKSGKEISGQIPRLLLGGVKSFVGHVPTGNTGGANVPPLKKMEIPTDIKNILKDNT